MRITSPAFGDNKSVPVDYTCDGEDINPPLIFSEVPEDTVTLTLILSDPDAPDGNFIHWIVFNIDPGITKIAEDTIPQGGVLGTNAAQKTQYTGPCPPSGTHRYIFKLYALDMILDLEDGATPQEVEDAMEGHIIDIAEMVGLYSR